MIELKVRKIIEGMNAALPGKQRERPEGVLETVRLTFRVAPAGAHLVKRIDAVPEIDAQLAIALNPSFNQYPGSHESLTMQLYDVDDLPVRIAYDVICKQGDKQVHCGTITSRPAKSAAGGDPLFGFGYGVGEHMRMVKAPREFKGKPFDVILRPNPAAVLQTVDQTEVYMGEIVLEGVTVPERRRW